MPKIRRKIKEVSNNDYVNPVYNSKSGILTKSYKNILDKDAFDQGTIPSEKVTTGNILNNYNELFNDNNTAIFSENTDINATLRIPASFLQKLTSEENKIFHSPNTFNEISGNTLTSPVNDTFKSSYYDDVFYKNNFLIEYTPYQENKTGTIFEKLEVNQSTGESIADSFKTESSFIDSLEENYEISDQTSIEIELDFSSSGPAYLQNNKIWLDSERTNSSNSITFIDSGKKFPTYNTPIAYFDFQNNRWDYIAGSLDFIGVSNHKAYPPGVNYKPSIDERKQYSKTISESNIGFSPSFNINPNIYNVSTPCFNAKFPIGRQWTGDDRNLFNLKKYITDDFLLEKIIFECNDCESISEKNNVLYDDNAFNDYYYQNSEIDYLSNSFTFFILKQNDNINGGSFFENSGLDVHKKYKNELYFEVAESNNDPASFSAQDSLVYEYEGNISSYYKYRNSNTTFGSGHNLSRSFIQLKKSKREILTCSTFFIHNIGISSSKLSNILSLNNHISKTEFVDSTSNINKEFSIKLESNCNTFNKSSIHNYHTVSNVAGDAGDVFIFSNNYFGGKDMQSNANSNIRVNSSNKIATSLSLYNKNINTLDKSSYDSPVILHPDDNLIFGINSYTNANIQPYMFILKNKVKITLIGRHLQDKLKISTKKSKNVNSSKSLRNTIKKEIVNEYNTYSIDQLSNTFVDKVFTNSIDIQNIDNTNILDLESIGKISSKNFGSFTHTTNSFDKEVIYDSLLPSIFEYIGNFSFNDINLSNNTLTLNYNNSNSEWLETFPYKENYNNNSFSTENRNSKILNKIKEIDNILVDVSNNNFVDHTRLYQYINLIDYSSPSQIRSFGNQTIKEDIVQNNKNVYKVYKNLRGFIETNDLSIENNLNYLTQDKSNSIEIPTNIYADVVVWRNTVKNIDEYPWLSKVPNVDEYYYAQIVNIKGDFFDISGNALLGNSYSFPADEDNLDINLSSNKFHRLVFYNPEVSTQPDLNGFENSRSYKYDSSNSLEHIPHKLISRFGLNSSNRSTFDGFLNSNDEWDKISDITTRTSNKIYYLEKERNINIKRVETIELNGQASAPSNLSSYSNIDFVDSSPEDSFLTEASILSSVNTVNYLNGDSYTIPSIKLDGTVDAGSTSIFTFTDQTNTWTSGEISQGYKISNGNAHIKIFGNLSDTLNIMYFVINNENNLNTWGKLYAETVSSGYGFILKQANVIYNASNVPVISESIQTQNPPLPVTLNNFSISKTFYKYESTKTLTLSDYDNEVDTVNKVNTLFFGFSNKKGTSYKRHPLERVDGWKFGVYSGIKNYVKKRFNWKKFGQFSDMENGSQNFAIFKEDGSVSRPLVKTFYDSYYYPIDTTTASNDILSAMNTYNKDPYARHTVPFIES